MANEKIIAILDSIKALTVLELSELVSACEEEFGVQLRHSEEISAELNMLRATDLYLQVRE